VLKFFILISYKILLLDYYNTMEYSQYANLKNEIQKLNKQKQYLEEYIDIKIFDLNYPKLLCKNISIRRLDTVLELKRLFYEKAKLQGMHFSYTGFLTPQERRDIAKARGVELSASIPEFNEDYSRIVFRKTSPVEKEEYLANTDFINDVLPNGGIIYVLSYKGAASINSITK
jgi:hypothetical protein